MATKVARGKALVAKLRAQKGVRDPEALAASLGRKKKARAAAKKAKGKSKSVDAGESKGKPAALPKTGKDAATLVADTFEKLDPKVKNDPALKQKIEGNYRRIFGDSVEKASPEKREALNGALAENAANPRLARAINRFGQPAVVLKRDDPNEDVSHATAYQRGPVTVVVDHPKEPILPSVSNVQLGGGAVDETLPGVLRHEFGHHVEFNLPHSHIPEFKASLPDGQTMKGDLSYYAGIEWKRNGNHQEPFAELVSLVTSPGYKPEDVPGSMKQAAKLVEGYLYG